MKKNKRISIERELSVEDILNAEQRKRRKKKQKQKPKKRTTCTGLDNKDFINWNEDAIYL